MHSARGNNPDQAAIATQRETDVKQPPRICVSESMQPDLIRTMAGILNDQQGFIKEDLLGFCLAHVMLFDTFAAVTFVPFEPLEGGGREMQLHAVSEEKHPAGCTRQIVRIHYNVRCVSLRGTGKRTPV